MTDCQSLCMEIEMWDAVDSSFKQIKKKKEVGHNLFALQLLCSINWFQSRHFFSHILKERLIEQIAAEGQAIDWLKMLFSNRKFAKRFLVMEMKANKFHLTRQYGYLKFRCFIRITLVTKQLEWEKYGDCRKRVLK